jgi:hypothetical protein
LPACLVADKQVLAKVVKKIDVVTRDRRAQARAHFPGEYLVAETLSLADLVLVLGPGHDNCARANLMGLRIGTLKRLPGPRNRGQRKGRRQKLFHNLDSFNFIPTESGVRA